MARSFSKAAKFVANEISSVVTSRRGYAKGGGYEQPVINGGSVYADGMYRSVISGAGLIQKIPEEPAKISWVPHPVTGYYRPEDQADEIDPAELRAMLLNKTNDQADDDSLPTKTP